MLRPRWRSAGRACGAAVTALLIAAAGCRDAGDAGEDAGPGASRPTGAERPASVPGERVDVALVPADAIARFEAEIERASAGPAPRCPAYAPLARDVLTALGGAAGATAAALGPRTATATVRTLAIAAAPAAASLAALRPADPAARRRHRELVAATRDLSAGFSALAAALEGGDDSGARAALARTRNGLGNVAASAAAVFAACQ